MLTRVTSRPRPELPGLLTGLATGCGLAVLAALLGEVRAPAPLLLGVILLCGALGAWRPTRLLLGWGAGLLAAAVALCLLTPVLRGPLNALTVSQLPVRADAVVVLGAGVQCGAGTLEATSLTRLVRGLELWRAGYAPTVTVSQQSGLIGPHECAKMSDLERAHIAALYPAGGPEVLTLRTVTTTRDEAARVGAYARERGWRRVLIVTSPWHARRTQALFRAQGVDAVSVPAPESRFDYGLLYPHDRLAALRVLLYEGLSRVKFAVGGTPERGK
ncbi:hypothetical protein ASF71_04135 [Deinococcus sp. Leaf326]|nr:hypothetical protein ASF71_04135 [Deinococcus sp. Leaf326]